MGTIKISGKVIQYTPYYDDILMERLKARLVLSDSFANVFKENLTDGFIQHLRNVVNPKFHHEENTILSCSGFSGSSKSMSMISLVKLVIPERFTYKNICFYEHKIAEIAKDLPRDTFAIKDENPDKAVHGAGSDRISMDFKVLVESVRKYGLSIILIEPAEKENDVVKWYLETVDIDYENRITRLALKDPKTKSYLGAVYIPVVPNDDYDWVEYNKIKDKFIDDRRAGNYTGAKDDYTSLARELVKKLDTDIFTKKNERLIFVQSQFPSFTNQEIKIIHCFVEVILKGGDASLPVCSEKKAEPEEEKL